MAKTLMSLFDIGGRLNRRGFYAFWAGYLAYGVMLAAPLPLESYLALPVMAPAMTLAVFAMIRRLHDRGRTGWWLLAIYGAPALAIALLWLLLPDWPAGRNGELFAVATVLFAFASAPMFWCMTEMFLLRGTRGDNRFGSDPSAVDAGHH